MPRDTLLVGLPFFGYWGLDEVEAPDGYVTGASRNYVFVPYASRPGQFVGRLPFDTGFASRSQVTQFLLNGCIMERREGSATQEPEFFSTPRGLVSRELISFRSASLVDGYPTRAILCTDENDGEGLLYVHDTNGEGATAITDSTCRQWPCKSMDNIYYPAHSYHTERGMRGHDEDDGGPHAGYVPYCLPMAHWSENAQRMMRFADESQQMIHCPGSRRSFGTSDWWTAPSSQGTPTRWNRVMNDGVSTVRLEHVSPLGHIVPLWPPGATQLAATAAGEESPYKVGDSCWLSVAFIMEDGTFSKPFEVVPVDRAKKSDGTWLDRGISVSPGYFKILGTDGSYVGGLEYNSIPIGPPGVRGRALLRSPFVSTGFPDPGDLRVVAIIDDNVTEGYIETGGDAALVADSVKLRLDHVAPHRGRYMWAFDGRVAIGGAVRPNPGALFVTQRAFIPPALEDWVSTYQFPASSPYFSSICAAVAFVYNADTGAYRIELAGPGANRGSGFVLNDWRHTVGDFLDFVNGWNANREGSALATQYGYAGSWAAQRVPGVDRGADLRNLEISRVEMTCHLTEGSAVITSSITPYPFAKVRAGMRVHAENGGGFVHAVGASLVGVATVTRVSTADPSPANHSVTADSNWTLPSGNYRLWFGYDFHDIDEAGYVNVDTTPTTRGFGAGSQRCYANVLPAVLYWSHEYQDKFPAQDQMFCVSGADPLHPINAVNNFYSTHSRHSADASAGRLMGGVGLLNGCVVLFERALGIYRNQYQVKSGFDKDYRFEIFDRENGCISWSSITGANGACVFLSPKGLCVTDGQSVRVLSRALYDPSRRVGERGELEFEVAHSTAESARDSRLQGMQCFVSDGILYVSYRVGEIGKPLNALEAIARSEEVTADPVPNLFSAWSSTAQNGTRLQRLSLTDGTRIWNDDGVPVGSSSNVVSGGSCCVLASGDDGLLVAWTEHSSSGQTSKCGVYIQRFDNSGTAIGTPTEVVAPDLGVHGCLRMIHDNVITNPGGVYLSWGRYEPYTDSVGTTSVWWLYVQRFTASAAAIWRTPLEMSPATDAVRYDSDGVYSLLECAGGGGFIASNRKRVDRDGTWKLVWAFRFNYSGVREWANPATVETHVNYLNCGAGNPRAVGCRDGAGGLWLAAHPETGYTHRLIHFGSSAAAIATLNENFTASDVFGMCYSSFFSRIVVAYFSEASHKLYYRILNSSTATWRSPVQSVGASDVTNYSFGASPFGTFEELAMVDDGIGGAYVAFSCGFPGVDGGAAGALFLMRVNEDAGWAPKLVNLYPNADDYNHPKHLRLNFDASSNEVTVVWRGMFGSPDYLYAKKYSSLGNFASEWPYSDGELRAKLNLNFPAADHFDTIATIAESTVIPPDPGGGGETGPSPGDEGSGPGGTRETAYWAWRQLRYDFTRSMDALGVLAFLRSDGEPYGWSTPQDLSMQVAGSVRRSDGTRLYGVNDYPSQTTNAEGRAIRFDRAMTFQPSPGGTISEQPVFGDDGVGFTPIAYSRKVVGQGGNRLRARRYRAIYRKNGTGMRLQFSVSETRPGYGVPPGVSLPRTNFGDSGPMLGYVDVYSYIGAVPLDGATPVTALQVVFSDDLSGDLEPPVGGWYGVLFEADTLRSKRV